MKFKLTALPFLISSIAMSFVAITVFSIQSTKPESKNPRYILSGYLSDETDPTYDYYDIGNGEYAIALKDSVRDTFSGTITIPSTYKGKKVTGIWHNGFQYCKSQSITFKSPSNITVIDYEAFFYSNLTSITIPYTIEQLGDAAFYYSTSLATVTFENSNEESSGSALDCYCEIDDDPQEGGEGEEPSSSSAPSQSSESSSSASSSEEPSYQTCTLEVIPTHCFFECSSLQRLSLPSSIKEVRGEAFSGCVNLSSDLFFEKIEFIGERAFQSCAKIKRIYISKSLFENVNGEGIQKHAFNYCNPELDIYFCGDKTKIKNWVDAHELWGWNTDYTDPATHSYPYKLQEGDNHFKNDWAYSVNTVTKEVTIAKYLGAAPTTAKPFISFPNKLDGYPVTQINVKVFQDVFNDVNNYLERIYLPTGLKIIDNLMFRYGYSKLHVIDSNYNCESQKEEAAEGHEITGRIDLSGLTSLEFIGNRAFAGIGGGEYASGKKYREKIVELHLPYNLVSIGDEAFGIFANYLLPNVTSFLWDYDDVLSRLQVIGTDAFYGLGVTGRDTVQITGNQTWKSHSASTIIFPRTFKYFGLLDNDVRRFATPPEGADYTAFNYASTPDDEKASKKDKPAHAFAGCSLLGKVIFKGSLEEDETTDLVIPLQTFVYNESLHTIIFEERANHHILFHTQCPGQHYAQESIGGNSGRGDNDFRGEPFLQTLILPTQYTYIHVQNFAFHANSRAAMYLSGTLDKVYCDNTNAYWTEMIENPEGNPLGELPLSQATQWKTIGSEDWYASNNNSRYYGYCFAASKTSKENSPDRLCTYGINQEIPLYQNVHYLDEEVPCYRGKTMTVEVGGGVGAKEFTTTNKCAFLCEVNGNEKIATMTKYLYNLKDGTNDQTKAIIPETVKVRGKGDDYDVVTIGESAFSACYCDGSTESVGFNDLNEIILPDSIKEIKDYAFIRTYGVTTIKAYTGSSSSATERMPTSLRTIGKNAFLFSGITKLLKIPYECLFYENIKENNVDKTKSTSIFSNAVSLRKVTFLDENDHEGNTSKYYSVTTYTSTGQGHGDCVSALYSNSSDNNNVINQDRLLLVFNRDLSDIHVTNSSDYTKPNDRDYPIFNGNYKNNSNSFLYGAYNMGYFIYELNFANPTKNASQEIYPQPLFCAVGDRADGFGELTTKVVYLEHDGYFYQTTNTIDCKTISGAIFDLPGYATNGAAIKAFNFPYKENGVINDGVFANKDAQTEYNTLEGQGPNIKHSFLPTHTLDLRDTGYIKLGSRSFENNPAIWKFIAPDVNSFTIGSMAFSSCTNLDSVDFSTVKQNLTIESNAFNGCSSLVNLKFKPDAGTGLTGNLIINTEAFKGCSNIQSVTFGNVGGNLTINKGAFNPCSNLTSVEFGDVGGTLTIGETAFVGTNIQTIDFSDMTSGTIVLSKNAFLNCTSLQEVKWPTSGNVTINMEAEGIFQGCTGLTEFELPTTLTQKLGNKAFYGCTNLEKVTADGNIVNLQTIGESAFENCSKLDIFDFSHMTSLVTIKKAAFQKAGALKTSAEDRTTNIPGTVNQVDTLAFKESGVIEVNFSNHDPNVEFLLGNKDANNNDHVFANCDSLVAIRFDDTYTLAYRVAKDRKYPMPQFDECDNLVELRLPSSFDIANKNGAAYSTIKNSPNVKIYFYGKWNGQPYTGDWRSVSGSPREINFYVGNINDLQYQSQTMNNQKYYWTENNNGEAIYLGQIKGYADGVADFDEYTFDSNGLHAK